MKEISFRNDVLPLKDKFFRLALRLTRNREEAEDIVQETLLRLWNKREELKTEGIETLGFTICHNLAIDHLQKKETQNIAFDPALHEAADSDNTPADQLIAKEGQSENYLIEYRTDNIKEDRSKTPPQVIIDSSVSYRVVLKDEISIINIFPAIQ